MNLLGYTYKIYNSGYNTEMINKQCNAGDPLETPGGVYRGLPSMFINVNTIKRCGCETLNQVQCSITIFFFLIFYLQHNISTKCYKKETLERNHTGVIFLFP